MNFDEKLADYAKNHLNVLLSGPHGIGKTERIKKIANDLNLNMAYYSSSTLDPWTDIVGVPKPVDGEKEELRFYRPSKILNAEFLFFDELNRAHPKVLNAVLEIIQFKSVNGTPLPNLKMVWAAINPPGGEYNVEDLDPALMDRFHIFMKVKAEFSMDYMSARMKRETAEALQDWWMEDMDSNQRHQITPRRLEYLGVLIDKGLDWMDGLPEGTFPHGHLRQRLADRAKKNITKCTKENILNDPNEFREQIKIDPTVNIQLRDVLSYFNTGTEFFAIRDLLEEMPKDIVFSIANPKFKALKRDLAVQFTKAKINFAKKYPNITDCFSLKDYA